VDIWPEDIHITIDDGTNSTSASVFKDGISEECPTQSTPLCGEAVYSLELAEGGAVPF